MVIARDPSDDGGIYQDPPPAFTYQYGAGTYWYIPQGEPARPTHIRQTPMGPMATGALPEGMEYDAYGNAVYTDGNGQAWTYTEDGQVARVDYTEGATGPLTRGASGTRIESDYTITPVTKDDYESNAVPVAMIRRDYRRSVRDSVNAAGRDKTGTFGVTSPGSRPDEMPAGMGGPLNDPGFIGSDLLRDATAAQNPGWTSQQVDEYVQSYTVRKSLMDASKRYYDASPEAKQKGTYYQRYAVQKAAGEGYGRPQYKQGAEYAVLNMDQMALIQLQQQLIAAKVPGSSSIVIGQVGDLSGDDATLTAYRNALSGANLRGIPVDAYLAQGVQMARMAERAGLKDGSPGDPRFDPTRVQRVVNLTGRARARAQLKTMMTQMLGRAPTEGEVDAYLNQLNAKEEADPTIRTTTYTRSGDSSTTTETTDVDPVLIAERQIKKENPKQYREYQELEYYNAMLSMMGEG